MTREEVDFLRTIQDEMCALIAFKNSALRSQITACSTEEPEWHDYQSAHEFSMLITEAELKLLDKSQVSTKVK